MTPEVLIYMHSPSEGPGSLGTWLERQGAELDIRRLYAGEELADDPGAYDGMISLGGPMNALDDRGHPWLKPVANQLCEAAHLGLPVLGICLGAQLLARGLGAAVVQSPLKEIGWYEVGLTAFGLRDPLLSGVAPFFPAFQWHQDMFHLPDGGRLLATAPGCPNQAFVWHRAYGLQFHVEVTPEIIADWCEDPGQEERLLSAWDVCGRNMARQGEHIYQNFWTLLMGGAAQGRAAS